MQVCTSLQTDNHATMKQQLKSVKTEKKLKKVKNGYAQK